MDLESAIKKVRPIKTWGFVIPFDKVNAYSFAADCKSAEQKKVRTFFVAGFQIISG